MGENVSSGAAAQRSTGGLHRVYAERLVATERRLAVWRLVVVASGTLIYPFLMDPRGTIPWLAYAILGLAWAYALVAQVWAPMRRYASIGAGVGTSVADGALTMLWLYATGGLASPFFVALYLGIVAVAFRFPVSTTWVAATLYGGGYALLAVGLGQADGHLAELVVRVTYVFLAAGIGGLLSARVLEQDATRVGEDERTRGVRAPPSWELLQVVADGFPGLVAYVDADRRYQVTNRTFAEWFGVSAADIRGRTVREIVGEAAYAALGKHVDAALAGRRVTFDSRLPCRQAGARWVHVTYVPATGPDGRVEGFVAFMQDDRERADAWRDVLAQASRQFAEASLDPTKLFETVARQVASAIGDGCLVRLLAEDGVHLEPVGFHHTNPETLAFVRAVIATEAGYHRVDDVLSGRVLRTGESLLVSVVPPGALRAETAPGLQSHLERLDIRSLLAAPLRVGGRTIGSLSVIRQSGSPPYTVADQTCLEQLADRAAAAVELARLHRELEQGVETRTAELAETARALRYQTTLHERLVAAQSEIGDGVALTEGARIVFANDALARIYGYTVEELRALPSFLEIVAPEARPALLERLRQVQSNLDVGVRRNETVAVRKDGRRIDIEYAVTAVGAGEPTLRCAIIRDITDRKRADAERARLANVVETAEDAIVATDADDVVETWNAGAERLLGYAAAEVVGRSFAALVPPDGAGEHRACQDRLRRGEPVLGAEVVHVQKSGRRLDVSLTATPLRAASGAVVGYSRILRDITASKEAARRVEASLREKEVLLKEIHHRVRNNLQVITSLVNLQARRVVGPADRNAFKSTQDRIRSIALLHERLYVSSDPARIDVGAYVAELVASLRASHGERADAVAIAVDAETLRLEVGAAIPCGLIVTELVTNALEHAFPDGRPGRVTVELRREPRSGRYELAVRDDGVGFPPGFAIDAAPTLGLQIVAALARQLRGTLAVDRAPGAAVRMSFDPPADDAAQEHA